MELIEELAGLTGYHRNHAKVLFRHGQSGDSLPFGRCRSANVVPCDSACTLLPRRQAQLADGELFVVDVQLELIIQTEDDRVRDRSFQQNLPTAAFL